MLFGQDRAHEADDALAVGEEPYLTTTKGQNAAITFSGTAGRTTTLQSTGSGYPTAPQVTLRKPDGTTLWSGLVNSTFTCSLPATGNYTIKIDPKGTDTGSITAQGV